MTPNHRATRPGPGTFTHLPGWPPLGALLLPLPNRPPSRPRSRSEAHRPFNATDSTGRHRHGPSGPPASCLPRRPRAARDTLTCRGTVWPRHSVSPLDEHGVGEEEAAGGRSRQTDHWAGEQLSLREQFEQGCWGGTLRSHSHHILSDSQEDERGSAQDHEAEAGSGAEEPQRGPCTRSVCPGSCLRLKDKAVALGIRLPEERRCSAPKQAEEAPEN